MTSKGVETLSSTAKRTKDRTTANLSRCEALAWLAHARQRPTGASGTVLKNVRIALGFRGVDIARYIPARTPGRYGQPRMLSQHTISDIESGAISMPRGFFRAYVRGLDDAVHERDYIANTTPEPRAAVDAFVTELVEGTSDLDPVGIFGGAS